VADPPGWRTLLAVPGAMTIAMSQLWRTDGWGKGLLGNSHVPLRLTFPCRVCVRFDSANLRPGRTRTVNVGHGGFRGL
jgi:hypothetical protein